MSGYKCTIEGADDLLAKLREAKRMPQVGKIVNKHTIAMAAKMKEEAPVDTGFLRNSIIFDVAQTLRGEVTPTADYAVYVNYGTRYMSANEFIGRAFNYQKVLFLADLRRLVQ
ncbi:HK97 gp10 family phage protein [Enterococcus faecium]|nr:HK97 gp10 family phage protein [Enterococcus faecium]